MTQSTLPFTLAIDVGAPVNVGWALPDASGTGADLDKAVDQLAAHLSRAGAATIGFEAPVWTPRRTGRTSLNKARLGEGSKPWSGGIGTAVLASGLGLMPWVFGRIALVAPGVRATVNPDKWRERGGLFIWEAFVTGKAKTTNHEGDAQAALNAFNAGWPDLVSDIEGEPAVNLAVAAALAAGLAIDPSEIGLAALVIMAKP